MTLVLSFQMVFPKYTLSCSEKVFLVIYPFQHVILSAYSNVKNIMSISGIRYSILLIIKSIVTETSDIIGTLKKQLSFQGFSTTGISLEFGSFLLLSLFTFFCLFCFALSNSSSLNYIQLYQTSIKSSVEHSRCSPPLCNLHFSSCSLLVFMTSF